MVVMVMGIMVVMMVGMVIKAERGLIRMSEARKRGEKKKKTSTPSLHLSGDLDNPPRLP